MVLKISANFIFCPSEPENSIFNPHIYTSLHEQSMVTNNKQITQQGGGKLSRKHELREIPEFLILSELDSAQVPASLSSPDSQILERIESDLV